MLKFEDGSTVDTEDFARMLRIVQQRAKDGKKPRKEGEKPMAAPTEIIQSGVTVKLNGLKAKDKGKLADHEKFIEFKDKSGWTIRVWDIPDSGVYGSNYFLGEDVRYVEVPYDNVRDINGVFKYVAALIEDIE